MRKPNYSMERKDRERSKQAKAAAKLEKRAAKVGERADAAASASPDDAHPGDAGPTKPKE
jgi:hypothetical protein